MAALNLAVFFLHIIGIWCSSSAVPNSSFVPLSLQSVCFDSLPKNHGQNPYLLKDQTFWLLSTQMFPTAYQMFDDTNDRVPDFPWNNTSRQINKKINKKIDEFLRALSPPLFKNTIFTSESNWTG
jgi:hypothetical protein